MIVTTCPFFVLGDVHFELYYYNFMAAASLEMRFCLARQSIAGCAALRAGFADDKSRYIFDEMTQRQADGQIWFRHIYEPQPYFGNDVVPSLPDGEVFVDAGAYKGDHIAAFQRANSRHRTVYAFEPYQPHFQAIVDRFANDPRVKPIAKGLYCRNSAVTFDHNTPVGAHIVTGEGEGSHIEAVRLDDVVNEKVTYIKMDIEGSELDALDGCKATILRDRPRLAICVYHRPSDYFDIPRLIQKLRPDYKLYLRQHSPFNVDTVLYCV